MRSLTLLLTLLLPGLATADLPTLMARLASLPHPPRHFTEQRHSEFLQAPVSLQGTLSFNGGRLIKTIEAPFFQRFTIEGGSLLIESDDTVVPRQIPLNEQPLLFTFVTLFRATLQGDLGALQQHYLTELEEEDGLWRLTLRPQAADVAVHLKRVTIEGNVQGAQRFHIEEQSGDSSLLVLGRAVE